MIKIGSIERNLKTIRKNNRANVIIVMKKVINGKTATGE